MAAERVYVRMVEADRAMARDLARDKGLSVSDLMRELLHTAYAEHRRNRRQAAPQPKAALRLRGGQG